METENEKKAIKYLDLKAINAPYEEEIKKDRKSTRLNSSHP